MLNGERQPQGDRKQAEIDPRPLSKQLDTQQHAGHRKDRYRKIGHHHWSVRCDGRIDQREGQRTERDRSSKNAERA